MDHYDYNTRPSMDTSRPKSKLGRFMLIGGLVGAGVSLFDRGTRKQVANMFDNMKDGSASFMTNMRQDPAQVTNQISNYLTNTANNIKGMAQEVSDDMRQMAQNVTGMTQSTKQAYQYAMEAGSEISEIASKIKHSGSTLSGQSNSAYLPSTTTTSSSATSSSSSSTSSTSSSIGEMNSSSSTDTSSNYSSSQNSSYDSNSQNTSYDSYSSSSTTSGSKSSSTSSSEGDYLIKEAQEAIEEIDEK